MCLPLPSDDRTILDLLEEMRELEAEAIRLRDTKPPCRWCDKGEPCWFHRPFVPIRAHEEMK